MTEALQKIPQPLDSLTTADAMALELAGDRIASLEHDVVAYRELCQLSIHKLHDLTKQNDRLREQLRELRSQYREAA